MRVLVTGAAGFIGSHLVDRLLGRGDTVVGLDNFDSYYSPAEKRENLAGALTSPQFRLLEADVTEPDSFRKDLAGVQLNAIIHLAARVGIRPSVEDPMGYTRVNVAGTEAMLDFAKARGIERFVFGSSSSVYGNSAHLPFSELDQSLQPISPYAETKRSGELLCQAHQAAHGGSVWCLRFFSVYGPRQRPDLVIRKFCSLIAANLPVPVYGDGSAERDFTWVGDLVDGVVGAIDRGTRLAHEFQIVNLGTGHSTSMSRLLKLIGDGLGLEPAVLHRPAHSEDVTRTTADIALARRLLSYDPGVRIEQGIRSYISRYHLDLSSVK